VPQQPAVHTAAADYANTFRFLFAGATDGGFRNEVGSGDKGRIKAALVGVGIDLPAKTLKELVAVCIQIAELGGEEGNGWNLFDKVRVLLGPPGGHGAA